MVFSEQLTRGRYEQLTDPATLGSWEQVGGGGYTRWEM